MTILSAQSIRKLCKTSRKPLISPFTESGIVRGRSYGLSACSYDCRIDQDLILDPGQTILASTIERFCFPNDICGHVLDKSSYARLFISVFNTHFDPGFEGWATIELAHHGIEPVQFKKGDPICQFKFEWLDEPTDLPYKGKYQNQEFGPQEARFNQEKK